MDFQETDLDLSDFSLYKYFFRTPGSFTQFPIYQMLVIIPH